HPPQSTLFTYTTLFRSKKLSYEGDYPEPESQASDLRYRLLTSEDGGVPSGKLLEAGRLPSEQGMDDGRNLRFLALAPLAKKLGQDRKSTRLNSSHQIIS